MYQCVHYIKYTSIYKVHVPMCPLYKVHLYIQSTCVQTLTSSSNVNEDGGDFFFFSV